MSRWLEGLNPEQREAVQHVEGPLLVLAGAGSGKTRVITHRVTHLIEQGVAAENLLGVTFTNKAAHEMRHRLSAMVGRAAREVTLSTFHSLGLEIMRQEARRTRRSRPFTIFDTGDQLATLRQFTRQLRLGKGYDLGAVLGRISQWKNDFVEPGQTPNSEDPYDEVAALLYPRYVEQLRAYRALDFDDLICEPVRLLERSEAARARWSQRFRYVLVDEYQDTNPAQFRLLRALVGAHRNVCVVGDDDQSIYGWRGADVRNILQFGQDFPGARVVYLMRNYRSVGAVLQAANQVISENPDRHPKAMQPVRGTGARVRMVIHPEGESELQWVAREIRKLVDKRGKRYADLAVMYRSNTQAKDLETELRLAQVPYRLVGGTAFYDRREVKDLVAYLKICVNPRDELSLRRVINTPPRGIGPRTVEKLSTWAEDQGRPLWDALAHAPEALGEDPRSMQAVQAVQGFRELVDRHAGSLRRGKRLADAVGRYVQDIGFQEEIQRSSESDKVMERRLSFVDGVVEGVERYCERSAQPNLREHLSNISLADLETTARDGRGDNRKKDGKGDRKADGVGRGGPDDLVTLSTLHGAKGLEFPVVFLIGLEEGLLPHDRTLNPQATDHVTTDVSEERRLCYVGMTRARDELYLSRARTRRVRGKLRDRTPSRFLDALPEEELDVQDLSAVASNEEVTSMLDEMRAKLGW